MRNDDEWVFIEEVSEIPDEAIKALSDHLRASPTSLHHGPMVAHEDGSSSRTIYMNGVACGVSFEGGAGR